MKPLFSSVAAFIAALLLTFLTALPAAAAGVVTDCTTFGPGPGTLATAVEADGLVTFACSGTIVVTTEIPLPSRHLVIDGSGQAVTLSGANQNRLFNVGPGSSLQLHNITLLAGNAGNNGGGAISSAGHLTITNSTLMSNTAAYGGALEIFNGSVLIQNSTLAGNRSLDPTQGGGAIDQYFAYGDGNNNNPNEVPSVVIQTSTIVGNHAEAPNRSGIWQENGKLQLRHSIIAHNGAGNCKIDAPNRGIQYYTTGSLDTDGSCAPAQQADPVLLPLGFYGGSTPMFALAPNSPAIDANPANTCAGFSDQRSQLRPRDGNRDGTAACDAGAYEYADRFLVAATNADGLAGYWKFDEGAGGISQDSSGNQQTAALQNGATFTSSHPALNFAAPFAVAMTSGAGAEVADSPLLNPPGELTVAAWVWLSSTGGAQTIAVKQPGNQGPGYGLHARDGLLVAEVWDSANSRHVVTGSITAGSWLHVALTYRQAAAAGELAGELADDPLNEPAGEAAGQMIAYINGRKVGAQAVSAGLSTSSAPLKMAVDGILDDVRVYNRALSPGAVAALAGGRSCVTAGTTWADAVPDLQCALAEARSGSEVWVGPGVYRPTHGPDRWATFAIGDGVAVYGGFSGTETRRDQRQPAAVRPVLSGDIQADDRVDANGVITEPSGVVGGNAVHVVTVSSSQTAVLERVTVTGGQATGDAQAVCTYACGGGIYILGGAPELRNLYLVGNTASSRGGGLYVAQGNPLLVTSAIQANQATQGGGVFFQDARPQVVNTLVAGNYAAGDGGGVYAANSTVRMVNVTVAANRARGSGGGLHMGNNSNLHNALVSGNSANTGAEIAGGPVTVRHSLVRDGCAAGISCGDSVQTGNPLFLAAPNPAGAPTSSGNFHVQPISPVIDVGNNNAGFDPSLPEGATIAAVALDLGDTPRIVAARAAPPRIDQGAYEAPNAPPVFTTTPVTQGAINQDYLYQAEAEDPNNPGVKLRVEVIMKPDWLGFAPQPDGGGRLEGKPSEKWFGRYDVVLRATDGLGASGDQAFILEIKFRANPVFLPQVLMKKQG